MDRSVGLYEFLAERRNLIDSLPEEQQFEIASVVTDFAAQRGRSSVRRLTPIQRHFAIVGPGGELDQQRKFLALETHPDPVSMVEDLVRLLPPLVAEDREKAHKIFRKAHELWTKNPSREVPRWDERTRRMDHGHC